jgi:hypothetical protein
VTSGKFKDFFGPVTRVKEKKKKKKTRTLTASMPCEVTMRESTGSDASMPAREPGTQKCVIECV